MSEREAESRCPEITDERSISNNFAAHVLWRRCPVPRAGTAAEEVNDTQAYKGLPNTLIRH